LLTVSFDRIASIYDATRWSGVPAPVMKNILDAMKTAFRDCRFLLDVGIGTGRFAEYFQNNGFTIIGIDVSLSMMRQAHQKGIKDLVRADIHHMPFRDQSFDGSLMIHVLHLARDWVQAIHEVGRVTKKAVVSEAGDGEGFDPRRAYLESRERMGYPLKRLNEGEVALRSIVPPVSVVSAGDYWTEAEAKEEIDSFEARRSSVTWDVTEEVHRRIMERLHSDYDGQTVRKHETPEVVGWDPSQLRTYTP
jgi:ubiquinone/menaquinone biosynthesis C-methylase UbiE